LNKLTPDILLALENLFNEKKWPIENGSSANPSLFDKFCARLKLLDAEEQKMVIELTTKFERIGLREYLEKFYDSFFCIGDSLINSKNKIFVYPLLEPYLAVKKGSDERVLKIPQAKTKSAGFLHYMCETDDWRWITPKFIHHTSMNVLYKDFQNDDSVLLLVDDFVGSGKTAVDACKGYLSEKFNDRRINPENLKVVCIAAQKQGIEYVKKEIGVDVISAIILNKGISENYSSSEAKAKLLMMENIGKILKVNADYLFGYEKSESLITFLNKTPNNTFPVYWFETRTRMAPFPRYKKYGR
jgi:hypothetical protein